MRLTNYITDSFEQNPLWSEVNQDAIQMRGESDAAKYRAQIGNLLLQGCCTLNSRILNSARQTKRYETKSFRLCVLLNILCRRVLPQAVLDERKYALNADSQQGFGKLGPNEGRSIQKLSHELNTNHKDMFILGFLGFNYRHYTSDFRVQ